MEESSQALNRDRPTPIGWRQWVKRAIFGLLFAYIWNSFLAICWFGIKDATSDGFDANPGRVRITMWGTMLFAAYFSSAVASFLGGFLGPLAMGRSPRVSRPILLSSAFGAAIATLTSVPVGLFIGWWYSLNASHSLSMVFVAMACGGIIGIGAGIIAGRLVAGNATLIHPAADNEMPSKCPVTAVYRRDRDSAV